MSMSAVGLALATIFLVTLLLGPCVAIFLLRKSKSKRAKKQAQKPKKSETIEEKKTVDTEPEPEPEHEHEHEPPSIMLGATESTDEGIETYLSSSSSDDKTDIEDQRQIQAILLAEKQRKLYEELKAAEQKRLRAEKIAEQRRVTQEKIQRTKTNSRSFDSSKNSHDTSVSNPGNAVDVHTCHSSYCKICQGKENGIKFVTAQPLEPKMVGKLQNSPARWWEFGESFVDLYHLANRIPRSQLNEPQTSVGDISSTQGMANPSKSSKRSLKLVSSDGDQQV